MRTLRSWDPAGFTPASFTSSRERALDATGQHVDVGGGVVVAGHAEGEPTVVRHDRHPHPHAVEDRDEGEALEHLPARQRQWAPGPGNVGDHGVDRVLRHPPQDLHRGSLGEGEGARGREPAQCRQALAGDRLVGSLERLHLVAHRVESLDRVGDRDRQVREDRRHAVVVGVVLRLGAHRHRDQCADHEPGGPLPPAQEQLPQPTGDGGDDDVVDGPAEGRPDRPYVIERPARPGPSPVRADAADERVAFRGRDAPRVRQHPVGDVAQRETSAQRGTADARPMARSSSYGISARCQSASSTSCRPDGRRCGLPRARSRHLRVRPRGRGWWRTGRCPRCRPPCSGGSS